MIKPAYEREEFRRIEKKAGKKPDPDFGIPGFRDPGFCAPWVVLFLLFELKRKRTSEHWD